MTRVLVLRPEPGATATAGRARQHGLDAVAMPLFEIEPVEWQAPDPAGFDALLLTSANAVRQGGEGLKSLLGLPVYAVGEATARAAREAGFHIAGMGSGGAETLLRSLDADLNLLHPCGEHRLGPAEAEQAITPVVVYRSRERGGALIIPEDCIALIHSPRAGRVFAGLVRDRSRIAIAAISPLAAEAVGGGWQSVDHAEAPTDDALLVLAARLCNKRRAE
jgi:uroporphyrinogen-III synthase